MKRFLLGFILGWAAAVIVDRMRYDIEVEDSDVEESDVEES